MTSVLSRRRGFTLIELLVVIGIITILFGLTVLIGRAFQRNEKAVRGTNTVQGILNIAKLQALRDRAPYGIRLLRDADGQVRRLQYIASPGDYAKGNATRDPNNPRVVSISGADLSGGLGTTDTTLWPVQAGDYLQVGSNDPRLIVAVTATTVTTQSDNPGFSANLPPTGWRIIRRPRPVAGEEIVTLPEGVIVDKDRSVPAITTDLDILFAPSGQVLGAAGRGGKVILWIRDADQDPNRPGDQNLVVVFTRTGNIGSFPVDNASGNPYAFIADPKFQGR